MRKGVDARTPDFLHDLVGGIVAFHIIDDHIGTGLPQRYGGSPPDTGIGARHECFLAGK
jgi:hypothetical protein